MGLHRKHIVIVSFFRKSIFPPRATGYRAGDSAYDSTARSITSSTAKGPLAVSASGFLAVLEVIDLAVKSSAESCPQIPSHFGTKLDFLKNSF